MKSKVKTGPKTVGAISHFLINNFDDKLSKSDVNEIFAFVLNLNYQQVLKMSELELNPQELKVLQKLLIKVAKGVPIAYLLGHKFFFNHDYLIDRGVLIPREDSELIVEHAMEFLKAEYPSQEARVVDLGTGSGVLGLSIASLRKTQDQYILSDISNKALKNATKNLNYLGLNESKFKLKKADFLKLFDEILPANLIVSNPPYIAKKDLHLEKSVSKYEPNKALYAKNNGLEFYELMAKNYSIIVDTNRPFLILMEFGFNQKEMIEQLFAFIPKNHKIEFLKDKKGNWRAFKLYNK